jgi:hypothetical protein
MQMMIGSVTERSNSFRNTSFTGFDDNFVASERKTVMNDGKAESSPSVATTASATSSGGSGGNTSSVRMASQSVFGGSTRAASGSGSGVSESVYNPALRAATQAMLASHDGTSEAVIDHSTNKLIRKLGLVLVKTMPDFFKLAQNIASGKFNKSGNKDASSLVSPAAARAAAINNDPKSTSVKSPSSTGGGTTTEEQERVQKLVASINLQYAQLIRMAIFPDHPAYQSLRRPILPSTSMGVTPSPATVPNGVPATPGNMARSPSASSQLLLSPSITGGVAPSPLRTASTTTTGAAGDARFLSPPTPGSTRNGLPITGSTPTVTKGLPSNGPPMAASTSSYTSDDAPTGSTSSISANRAFTFALPSAATAAAVIPSPPPAAGAASTATGTTATSAPSSLPPQHHRSESKLPSSINGDMNGSNTEENPVSVIGFLAFPPSMLDNVYRCLRCYQEIRELEIPRAYLVDLQRLADDIIKFFIQQTFRNAFVIISNLHAEVCAGAPSELSHSC